MKHFEISPMEHFENPRAKKKVSAELFSAEFCLCFLVCLAQNVPAQNMVSSEVGVAHLRTAGTQFSTSSTTTRLGNVSPSCQYASKTFWWTQATTNSASVPSSALVSMRMIAVEA